MQEEASQNPPCWDGSILDVRGLTKVYGSKVAVSEMFMRLMPGDVLGFLGPNGAGKTTTLRMLATVLAPDAGTAYVAGHPLKEVDQIRSRVGYMPDFLGVYEDLLVNEYLEFFARAYKVSPTHRDFVIKEALETTHLSDLAKNPVEGLSRGQKQRLGLARLLMHDPALLLLDEPAAGLDPKARVDLRDILRGLQNRGKAMIVSSHILSDVADFCNKVAIMANGKILLFDDTKRILDEWRQDRRLRLRVLTNADGAHEFLSKNDQIKNLSYDGDDLVFEFRGQNRQIAQLHRDLVQANFELLSFAEEPWDLEDIYLQVIDSAGPPSKSA